MFKNGKSVLVLMTSALSVSSTFAQSGSHGMHRDGQQQQQQQQGSDSKYPLARQERSLRSTLNSCAIEFDANLFTPLQNAYDSNWLFIPYLRQQKIWHEYRRIEKKFRLEFMPKSSPACAELEEKGLEKLKAKIISPERQRQ